MSLPNSAFLKGVGFFCIIVGFVEIGLGAEVWAFVPGVKYGSWWAAIFVVLSGLVAVIASNKLHVQVLMLLSTVASILCFSGMLVDSFGYRRVNDLETCVNTVTGEFYGGSGLEPEAAVCAQDTTKLCACVGTRDVCHDFDINKYRQQNCELILSRYTDLVLISAIFSAFCLAWVFVLSVMSCVTYSAVVAAENPPEVVKEVPMSVPADAEAPTLKPASPAASPVVAVAASPKAEESKTTEEGTVAQAETAESSV